MATLFLISPTAFQGHWKADVVGAEPTTPGRLFKLGEYSAAFGPLLCDAVRRVTQEKAPLLQEVPMEKAEFVSTTHVTTPSGQRVSTPPYEVSLSWTLDIRDVLDFGLATLSREIHKMADREADAAVDHLLKHTTLVTDAFGKVSHAGGATFGWPVILKALAKIEIDFTDDGDPILPKLVDDRKKRQVTPYPPFSEADRPSFDELMAKKFEEYRARSGRR